MSFEITKDGNITIPLDMMDGYDIIVTSPEGETTRISIPPVCEEMKQLCDMLNELYPLKEKDSEK